MVVRFRFLEIAIGFAGVRVVRVEILLQLGVKTLVPFVRRGLRLILGLLGLVLPRGSFGARSLGGRMRFGVGPRRLRPRRVWRSLRMRRSSARNLACRGCSVCSRSEQVCGAAYGDPQQ